MVFLTFERPLYLWLLLVLPLLYWGHYFFLHQTQKKAMKFANFETIKRIAGEKFVIKNITVLILRMLIITMLILSLSQTILWYDGKQSDFDYVFAIDLSSSMLAKDIEPSRFEFAKNSAIKFLDEFSPNAKFGLVTFSGTTYIINSLTEDKLSLKININALNVDKGGGTDLSNAIITSTNVLSNSEKAKAIILFTDGSNTVGNSIDGSVLDAVNYAKKNQVVIHALGIGTNSGPIGYLPELYGIPSIIDKETLEYITSETQGDLLLIETNQDLVSFFRNLEDKNVEGNIPFKFEFWGLIIGLFFLFIEWILINTIFRRVI